MSDFVDRRAVLRSGAVATALGLAGCLSRLSGDDATPGGNQSDDGPEPDDDGESAVSSWPSFQYDAGNSGHAEGRGPRGDLTEAWTFEREGKMRGGPVISEDGVVYVGSDEGTMYALDLEDGSLLWSTDTSVPVTRVPLIYEDLVITSTAEGVIAFDRHSGDNVWEYSTAKDARTPAVQDGIVVVGDGTRHVNGIDALDGTEMWRTKRESDLGKPAAIADGDAYVFDWTNELHVFELETGQHRYSAGLDERQSTGATVFEGVIYAGGEQGQIYALDATSFGGELWRFGTGASINESPAVTSDKLFVCNVDGGIIAIDRKTGTESWSTNIDYWSISAPAAVGDVVYACGDLGRVYGFDTESGDIVVHHHLIDGQVYHPSVAGHSILLGTSEGTVHALRE